MRFQLPPSLKLFSFNRTSMELKHVFGAWIFDRYFSFNRTSMELKHITPIGAVYVPENSLLIEPVWN